MSETLTKGEDREEQVTFQLTFDFDSQYSDIALREAIRGVKAITKECIRFGLDSKAVGDIMQTLAIWKPIVLAAADAIDEAIPD